jgi:transposase-like protein
MPKRRRRSFSPQFKAQVVLEVLSGQRSASESAGQHRLKPLRGQKAMALP